MCRSSDWSTVNKTVFCLNSTLICHYLSVNAFVTEWFTLRPLKVTPLLTFSEPAAAKPDRALSDRAESEPPSFPASEAGGTRAASPRLPQPSAFLQKKNTAPSRRKHRSYKVRLVSYLHIVTVFGESIPPSSRVFVPRMHCSVCSLLLFRGSERLIYPDLLCVLQFTACLSI